MSDIDRTRMIPLHIADQAVAACDAEIAKLREEIARLKAEVERLEKDLEYREDLALRVKRITDQFTTPEVLLLRAQVERLTKAGDAMASDLLAEFGRKEMLKYDPYQDWLSAKKGKPNA
jgi:outer membrane murein-binding lipoprotein Lpp